MKSKTSILVCITVLSMLVSCNMAEKNETKKSSGISRLDEFEFDHGLPTADTRQKLYDEIDFQRAVQAVIWAEPAINNILFLRAMEKVGVPNLGAMVYNERMHPGQETLTPTQSVVYLYDNINLKETGPVVYITPEAPINAGFFDMWMRPVYDFGTVGPNQGKGDKILLIPPGYNEKIPDGYQVVQPKTFQIFSITRLSVNKDMTAEKATEIFHNIQTYKLSDIGTKPKKALVLMGDPATGGKEFRMNRPTGIEFWKLVDYLIQEETVEDRDRITLGTLAGIGIEKGKPFNPDSRMEKILSEAETMGKYMMVNEAFSPRYATDGVEKELYKGRKWENIQLLPSMDQESEKYTFVIPRMIGFYQANGAQFAWNPRDFPPGFGQKYAAAYMDKEGNWLKGEATYKLNVPANVPVADFWAV
ncbi:MAG: DUF1254 domain-containing protein, partial [Chitinophagales bacterium]